MEIRFLSDITPDDAPLVGGKGLSLGLLVQAGLPVPPGFCVTTEVHRRQRSDPASTEFTQAIIDSYARLGAGRVAVRSSATAEDGAAASFAGQQETFLGVEGEAAVVEAVRKCWASLDSERARTYRARQGISEMLMAVVVQRLVPADVSGVLFTRDPNDLDALHMLVESSWGLGESVVSGRVTPDQFRLDAATGAVIDKQLGDKKTQRTPDGEADVAPEWQSVFCLNDRQLELLADLGRKVEEFFGGPRDIEWAWADGRLWLLQARPITTGGSAERRQVQREEIESLRRLADPSGTVWVRHNLSEVLPEPTPMTWSIVRRFMSGQGGYGRMFADLGFPPDPQLDDECIYDLVCGRPYMNLSREPQMQWGKLPFAHDYGALKQDPMQAFSSTANFQSKNASFGQKLKSVWRIVRGGWSFQNLARTFADKFRKETIPTFVAETRAADREDWSKFAPLDLLTKLNQWIDRTLITFARDSLKPTAFAASSLAAVQKQLEKQLGAERARQAIGELTQGVRPDADADLAGALQELARGWITRKEFLGKFGHRGSLEMELSRPRWREAPADLMRAIVPSASAGPAKDGAGAIERIAAEAKLDATQRILLRQELERLKTWLALRETGKHHLLRGYALIRRALVEIDRRLGLNGGVFFLTLDDLPKLFKGEDIADSTNARRKRHRIALSIEAPPVLFSDDLEAIGRPLPPPSGATVLTGIALSAGAAEGPALVVTDPAATVPSLDAFILVCPSTDPSWVPLFARAKGLVMETGGVLSHGAIVAREFGLPAVAGLPGVLRQLKTGQLIRVDGTSGTITIC